MALGLVDSASWDYSMDSILQARRSDNHLNSIPQSDQLLLHRRGGLLPGGSPRSAASSQNGVGAAVEQTIRSPRKAPSQTPNAVSPGKVRSKAKSAAEIPLAQASIHAKGSAAIRVLSPTKSEDAYVGPGGEGSLKVAHARNVLAGGIAQGAPDASLANAAQQRNADHTLVGKSSARAVLGHVSAPEGGRGHIRIQTPKKTDYFEVPGGTSLVKTGKASKLGQEAQVTASVTDGGRVAVRGGPSKKALTEPFDIVRRAYIQYERR